jgi:glycosyltransferase involved in cell wall biosynthesis
MQAQEIIMVDDSSEDDTYETLQKIVGLYSESVYFRIIALERNRGVASARNAGWDVALGRYVAFLDADDTWHPNKIEIQCSLMEENPRLLMTGHSHAVTLSSIDGSLILRNPTVMSVSFWDLIWRNRFVTSSVMVRNCVCQRFPEGQRYMEDHHLWLNMAAAGLEMARIEAELAAHHKADFGAGGLSGDLWAMERAELGNYRDLRDAGYLGLFQSWLIQGWSLVKFFRRVIVVKLRRSANP